VIVIAFSFSNMVWTGAVGVLGPIVAKRFLGGATAWGVIVAAEGAVADEKSTDVADDLVDRRVWLEVLGKPRHVAAWSGDEAVQRHGD